MKQLSVIISGGGTGGHVYPAIAIANQIKTEFPNSRILFVGAKDKMEMQKVPQAGYPIEGLWIAGFQRKFSLANFLFPIKLIHSLLKARHIIRKNKPDIVIGTGGFASGAVVQMAAQMKIPTLIQEQNSYPGITNKILSKKVDKICVAYSGLEKFFPKNKIVQTGNPVREDLLVVADKKAQSIEHFFLNPNKKVLLVLGGSLGARKINQLIEKELDNIQKVGYQILWQCGRLYAEQYSKYNQEQQVRVLPFIDRMDLAYAVSDVVISRAGASSVSELAVVGKPVIFIPSPNVAEDHQTKNAKVLSDKKAAILLSEDRANKDLIKELENISNPETGRALSANIQKFAKPNAAKDIVEQIKMLIAQS
ncbi:MAG: undecaprenyldiphospho-muramoylpentapeptide beta-N-acetylglucosaminyltransferase [Bacteroidota bacterium]|nr:undecaprenyldiphospho-muramoylpentapeptide beta-N-acetylglucosaminyltransferase [Bacteroidota bacterium]